MSAPAAALSVAAPVAAAPLPPEMPEVAEAGGEPVSQAPSPFGLLLGLAAGSETQAELPAVAGEELVEVAETLPGTDPNPAAAALLAAPLVAPGLAEAPSAHAGAPATAAVAAAQASVISLLVASRGESDIAGDAIATDATPAAPRPAAPRADAGTVNADRPALLSAAPVLAAPAAVASEVLRARDETPEVSPAAAGTGTPGPASLPLPAGAPAAPPAPPAITVPPGHPRWTEQVAASVVWSVREKLTEAELRLHPPELGPVRVHLRIEQGEIGVQFSAASAATREALEAALPRLRELFQQQGLSLIQAQVSDREHAPQPWTRPDPGMAAATEPAAESRVPLLGRLGLLDEYA